MNCGADCTRSDWLFGVAGICNNVTGICECPRGYDGRDDWREFNDCHMSVSARYTTHLFLFILNVVFIVFLVSLLCWLAARYERVPKLGDASSFLFPRRGSAGSENLSVSINVKQSGIGRNQTRILLTCLMLAMFPVCGMLYSTPLILDPPRYRYDTPFYQDFGFSSGISCFISGYWLVMYSWYFTLPYLPMLGTLFQVKSILITHPWLLPYMTYFHVPFIFVLMTTTNTFIPLADFDDLDLRYRMIQVSNALQVAFVAELIIVGTVVAYLLYTLFSKITSRTYNSPGTIKMRAHVLHARRTVVIWYIGSLTVAFPGMACLVLMGYSEFGERHIFLFMAASSVSAGVACAFCAVVFLRFKGSSEEKEHRGSSFSQRSMSLVISKGRAGSLAIGEQKIVIHKV